MVAEHAAKRGPFASARTEADGLGSSPDGEPDGREDRELEVRRVAKQAEQEDDDRDRRDRHADSTMNKSAVTFF